MGVGYLTGQVGGGSNVKSIQRGFVATSNQSSINITIDVIDETKSIVRIFFKPSAANNTEYDLFMAKITSSTNINLSRKTAYAVAYDVYWEVVEFKNAKSKQSGDLSVNGGYGFVAQSISSVDQQKSMIFVSAKAVNASANIRSALDVVKFDSSTQISVMQANQNRMVHWQVIEFK